MNRKGQIQGIIDIIAAIAVLLIVFVFFFLTLNADRENNAETVTDEITWEAAYAANSLAKTPIEVDGTQIALGEYLASEEADEDMLKGALEKPESLWKKTVEGREGFSRTAKLFLVQEGELVYGQDASYRFVDNSLQRFEREIEDTLATGTLADIEDNTAKARDWPRGIVQLTGTYDAAIILVFTQDIGGNP